MKHWKPDDDIISATPMKSPATARKHWPAGATAGLLLVAAGCVAFGAVMYHVAGPRDVFKDEAPTE